MNLLKTIQDNVDQHKLSTETHVLAVRSIVNWCHGNLMMVSRQRLNNIKQNRDQNYEATVDTLAGEPSDLDTSQERTEGLGYAHRPTLVQRGECFASIRQACFNVAEEKGWMNFDKPRNFNEYIESRITALHSREPTQAEVRAEMKNSLGMTEEEVKAWLIGSLRKQAEALEENREELSVEDNYYENDIEFEEAMNILGVLAQHRIRVKIIDALMFEVDRLMIIRQSYPNFDELLTKRHLLLLDAIWLSDELETFSRQHKQKITQALNESNVTMVMPTTAHIQRLELTRRQLAAEQKAA